MEDKLKTYRVEDSGQMTPMVNVWMTMEQYSDWLLRKNASTSQPVSKPASKASGFSHLSHAKPHFPARYSGPTGGASMSAELMERFLDAYHRHEGDNKKIGRELGIRPGSASSYKTIAVHNGLIDRTNTYATARKKTTGKPPINRAKAQEVADLYEIYGGDDESVAIELGVKPASARAYYRFARRLGLIKD